jgi:hypothetical protein
VRARIFSHLAFFLACCGTATQGRDQRVTRGLGS